MGDGTAPDVDLGRIIESARRLGVEFDEADALQWLTGITAARGDSDVVVDEQTGVFGHRVTMLDFSSDDLAHFRAIGRLVEFHDEPGVETGACPVGLRCAVEDPDLSRRLRLLRAGQHPCCHKG